MILNGSLLNINPPKSSGYNNTPVKKANIWHLLSCRGAITMKAANHMLCMAFFLKYKVRLKSPVND